MKPTSIEASFERFQRRGDPEDLGRVFDAVAPKLLLLAGHLAREGHDAEDLVQSTFIEVIDHRDRWSSDRPLMPWICGVLANLAKRQQRTHARSRTSLPLRQSVDDPALVAESRDSWAHLVAAIDRMEPIYRQALTLRLVRGMTNTEIAHTLGEPVETIRTRIHRGIQRMRGSLPSELSSGLTAALAVLGASRGLGAVRENVLAATVPIRILSMTSKTMLGGYVMSRAAIAVVLLLISALALLWFRGEPARLSAPPGVSAPDPKHLTSPPSEVLHASSDAPTRQVEATAESAADVGAPVVTDPQHHWRVHGQVQEMPFGEPVAGAQIFASVDEIDGVLEESCTTDDKGYYTMSLDPLKALRPIERLTCTVTLRARGEGVLPAMAIVTGLPRRAEDAFAREQPIHVLRGGKVTGRIVDPTGQPISGALVGLLIRPEDDGTESGGEAAPGGSGQYELSAHDGAFQIGVSLVSDRYVVSARHDDYGDASRSLEVVSTTEDVDVGDLVLRSRRSIEGRLLMQDGGPLERFQIYLRAAGSRRYLRTDDQGRFLSRSIADTPSHVGIAGAVMPIQEFPIEANVARDHVVDGRLLYVRATGMNGDVLPRVKFEYKVWATGDVPEGFDEAVAQGVPPVGTCLFHGATSLDGELRLLLPDGAAVFCNVGNDGLGTQSFGVRMVGAVREVVELAFTPIESNARVKLSVVDDLGEPQRNYNVSVYTSTGMFPAIFWTSGDPNGPPSIAPGSYRLRVECGSRRAQTHLPFETVLVLQEGETRRIHAVTPRGGGLRLHLSAELDGLGDAASIQIFGPDHTAIADLYLVDPAADNPSTPAKIVAGASLLAGAPLGLGMHRVLLSRPGLPDLERSFEVRAGTIAVVALP